MPELQPDTETAHVCRRSRSRLSIPQLEVVRRTLIFILKHFKREYIEFVSKKTGKTSYQDIKIIPINVEKNLQFRIRNVVFTDSYEFLSASLDTLVQTLKKGGKSKFVQTLKYLGDHDFYWRRGISVTTTSTVWTDWKNRVCRQSRRFSTA